MEIKAPKGLKDYRLKHVARLMMIAQNVDHTPSLSAMIQHVSAFTDTDTDTLREVFPIHIAEIFNNCVDALRKYEKREPVKEITIAGQAYTLVDIDKQKAGWLIDVEVEQEQFQTHPEKMAALCYIEKGKKYGDVKKSEREEIFKEHFPAYLFFDLNAFFLHHYVARMSATVLSKRIKIRIQAKKEKRRRRRKQIRTKLCKLLRLSTCSQEETSTNGTK